MKISVVILNWNRPQDTIKAAESVLAQNHSSFEVVLWDNLSTDDSKAVLTSRFASDPRVKLCWADANYGVAEGRNRAFRAASGDVFLSLDSDAWFEKDDALSRLESILASDPAIAAVSFEVVRPDGHLMWPFARPARSWREKTFDTIRVDGCSFAVRRNRFEAYGGFPTHYSPYGAEDQHFAMSLVASGFRVVYLPDVRVIHAFALTGRNRTQFTMHVRNCLWIPLELFPLPECLISFSRKALALLGDAREQGQVGAWWSGLACAVFGFRCSRRKAFSRKGWRALRELIAEDKAG